MLQGPRLLFFAGSARAASFNKRLARAAFKMAEAKGIAADLADLADYPMPLYDGDLEATSGPPDNARRLLALISGCDGIFIASPEYNASISPLLKNTLDWMSRIRAEGSAKSGIDIVKSRVIALGAASPGGTGGMRGLIALRYTLEMGYGALVLPEQVLVPRANSAFTDDGALSDNDARDRLDGVVAKLARTASHLSATGT